MEDLQAGQNARVLLVLDNFIEAADLQDAFERRRLGPVLHVRSVQLGEDWITTVSNTPDVVVVDGHLAAGPIVDLARVVGARVLVLNGKNNLSADGVVTLARPFGETDLSQALGRLMG